MTRHDGWTAGHRPVEAHDHGSYVEVIYRRHGFDDWVQRLSRDDFARLRRTRTIPLIDPTADDAA